MSVSGDGLGAVSELGEFGWRDEREAQLMFF
jgi:hypothetical protein